MEPNENLKPQPTGGLKLMTVFIAVLALHVVVIGGFTVWHLLYPSGTDADLTVDKTHKSKIMADSSIGDMPSDTSDKAVTPANSANTTPDSAVSAAVTTDTATTPPAATDTGSEEPPATPTMTTATTPATPAPVATPTMTEDASSTAANPPASTTPAVTSTHPVAVTTPDNLTPPADASASAPTPAVTTSDSTADAEAPATTAVDGTSYSVKRGDSLARIARRHHISLDELRSANSLKSDRLRIAQVITIPSRSSKAAPADAVATATAPAVGTTTAAADTTDTTSAVTPMPATHTVASTTLPHHAHKLAAMPHHSSYTVVRGDTLTKIAKRYHTTTSALVAANGLTNAGRLSIGQKLHIPSHETRGAATALEKPVEAEPHGAARAQLANYVQ
jgi:LysM repeat protein